MRILESRLDNVIFRMGLARTRKEARQIVDQQNTFFVKRKTGKTIPSLAFDKSRSTIEIKETKKAHRDIKNNS